jgi:formylglycine-generating enzyme required for sulfatase activity
MVIVPVAGGGSYCIDQYEVTKAEYNSFYQANPPVIAGLPPACAGNIFRPSGGWPFTDGREPVTYVDWCDAFSYCSYKQRHLCGKIGGGAISPDAFDDPTQSEWYNACSGQGVSDYPYGDEHEESKCVDNPEEAISRKPGPPNPSPPVPMCEGGVTGLYNMSGNVAEWENSCDEQGNCHIRGGSINSGADHALCGVKPPEKPEDPKEKPPTWPRRDSSDPHIGFRCCL